eukprot:CAMPEP_0115242404 /NCGR_PEP_ID=MMETSP0270-20121206/38934_1 /TAXON_ID=71861 /ORGANISM="Scrippsiella trochoidea, Strain CCMP3099" /LENGTH=44 /DNA_ID= /DNA_START= /DNA_END= /DNA_ORIENTATION=
MTTSAQPPRSPRRRSWSYRRGGGMGTRADTQSASTERRGARAAE